MTEWYETRELMGLPSMPSTPQGVNKAARANEWKWRKRSGKGGGKEYHISSLPSETQAALRALHHQKEPKLSIVADCEPTSSSNVRPNDDSNLTPDERAILELYRAMDAQQKVQAQTIVHVLAQPKINEVNKK